MSDAEPTPITGDVVDAPESAAAPEDGIVVRNPTGWSLVQHGNWEVSIGPDGLVMLPRHLAPEEIADFIGAVTKAAELSTELQAEAQAATGTPTPGLSSTLVIQESGQPLPAGAVPLQLSGGAAVASGNTVTPMGLADPTASESTPTLPRPPATNV